MPPQRRCAGARDGNARAEHVASRSRANQPQPQPVVTLIDAVDEETHGAGAVADEDIGVAVVVDVAEGRAAAGLDELKCLPGARGHIFEPAADVAQEQLLLPERKRIVVARGILHVLG